MLARRYRIPKQQISEVYKYGLRAYRGHLGLVFMSRSDKLQFAFVVSKKVDKRAVVRNRIKRRLRAAIYEIINAGDSEIPAGQYVFLVKSNELANMPMQKIQEDCIELIQEVA